jgi:Ca-activated chloride channel family protein
MFKIQQQKRRGTVMTTEKMELPKKKNKHLRNGITMLLASAALLSFPFIQQAMQGSISSGSMMKINASALQMDSVTVFDGGGYSGGGATTFRDMSNNMVTASGGFRNLLPNFGSSAPAPQPYLQATQLQSDYIAPSYQDMGRDKSPAYADNPVKKTSAEPVSTFSIDVDTASYSFLRKTLEQGRLPEKDSVRVEELINYFPYNYDVPKDVQDPFKPTVAVYQSPWNVDKKLLHIGIKGYELPHRPASNLVFLIDTSGSMNSPDKLPLLVRSFKLLLDTLGDNDTVSIVTYAGSAGVALEPTRASDKSRIKSVLDSLYSGGSTAGGAGIQAAYRLAKESFIKEGNNRVILATDGDFNVGISDAGALKNFIAEKRDDGIFLSVLGFGQGNYQDATMQALAQNGNGNAAYIDSLNEARKVLSEESGSTLFTIAKDVKIQVEFNPNLVRDYRLIGYETRHLEREDFDNDKIDAGEIGAGHTVTAIYEITPAGAPVTSELRYKQAETETVKPSDDASTFNNEIAFLKLRYKQPDGDKSILMTRPITGEDEKPFAALSNDVRFAASVAGFGQLLRGGRDTGSLDWDKVIGMAQNARGDDPFGYRVEFVNLVKLAKNGRSDGR